jgi:hypothetical protein
LSVAIRHDDYAALISLIERKPLKFAASELMWRGTWSQRC